MPSWLTLPNLFTFLRIALTPFVVQAVGAGAHGLALGLFLVAGFTDFLDGAAARRFGGMSQAGAYLDPIADKVLLNAVYVALAASHIVPWWFVGLVLARDVAILASVGIMMLTTSIRKYPPSVWGKASTLFQIIAALVWMVRNAAPSPLLDTVSVAALWTSAATTAVSGIDYARRAAGMLRRIDEGGAEG